MQVVKLLLGDSSLIIDNPPGEVLDYLAYNHRGLVEDEFNPRERQVVIEKTLLYEVVQNYPLRVITYQGFWKDITELLDTLKITWEYYDIRLPFPNPRVDWMQGLRYYQTGPFLRMVQACCSGFLKAPTRWGKTSCIANLCRVFDARPVVIIAPGVNLLGQLISDLQPYLPTREIKGVFTGAKGNKVPSPDITVCSMDSLHRIDQASVRMVIVDEPHELVTPTRIPEFLKFTSARIYGLGATLTGRFDNADKITKGLIGPILAERSFREAVDEGAICDIRCYLLKIPFYAFRVSNRAQAYKRLLHANPEFNSLVHKVTDQVIPQEWQTLLFIDEQKQADLLQSYVGKSEIAVACRMTGTERKSMFTRMVNNEIKRCIATDIYATGVTFPDLRVVVNACGGGGSITATQKPGRLAQKRPGKQRGYLVDFLFECVNKPKKKDMNKTFKEHNRWLMVEADCVARRQAYKRNGYEVIEIDNPSQITFEDRPHQIPLL